MRRRIIHIVPFLFLLTAFLAVSACTPSTEAVITLAERQFSAENCVSAVRELTSAKYGGRLAGTEGNALAAGYIRDKLKGFGIQPLPGETDYFQSFPQPTIRLLDKPRMELRTASGKQLKEYVHLRDFRANHHWKGVRTSGSVSGGLFFVEDRFQLRNLPAEAEEKILLISAGILRRTGTGRIIDSILFQPRKNPGIIIEREKSPGGKMFAYSTYTGANTGPSNEAGPFVFYAAPDAFTELREHTAGPGREAEASELFISMNSVFLEVESVNVTGFIPGRTDKTLIICAHFDHVGSLGGGAYCPGAIDNASGTAVILETARVLSSAARRRKPEINLVLLASNGEEQNLYGSRFFAGHFPFPPGKAAAVSIDMIGSANDVPLTIGTGGRENSLSERLKEAVERREIPVRTTTHAAASDHLAFAEKGIPAVFFSQEDYSFLHTQFDTFERSMDEKTLYNLGKFFCGFTAEYIF